MAVAGIDTHKDTLAVAVVDAQGRQLGQLTASNNQLGPEGLIKWLQPFEPDRIGVEGSGSHGRAAAVRLQAEGMTVVEVPPQLTAQARRRQRSQAKTDPIDALLIARIALRDEDLPPIRPTGAIEDLRDLVRYRRELRAEATRLASRIHADLERLRPGYQERLGRLTTPANLERARRLLQGDATVAVRCARHRLGRLRQVLHQLDVATTEVAALGSSLNHSLIAVPGIAGLTAAELLAEIGDIRRFSTKGQFAMANGTAPLAASSGRTTRFRVNRGGNRQLNRLIHLIAVTQISRFPEARAYYARKRAEGKTSKEALRCLKRHISNRIFVLLHQPLPRTT